jgi:hypothetical protein
MVKEFIVKEDAAFRLRVKSWKCLNPSNINAVEFIQECLKDGKVDFDSTYQFFMTDEELNTLAKGLTA